MCFKKDKLGKYKKDLKMINDKLERTLRGNNSTENIIGPLINNVQSSTFRTEAVLYEMQERVLYEREAGVCGEE